MSKLTVSQFNIIVLVLSNLRIFREEELPLLLKSGHFPELGYHRSHISEEVNQREESLEGFGDGPYVDNDSSLGKAKVPGKIQRQNCERWKVKSRKTFI